MVKQISAGLATMALLGALGAGSLAAQNASVAEVSDRGLAPNADSIAAVTASQAAGARGSLTPSALSAVVGGQPGAGNTAIVEQIGDYNRAFIQQTGRGNFAWLRQSGDYNQADVYQLGNQNEVRAEFNGSYNEFGIQQYGNNNYYFLDFVGDGLNETGILQQGEENTAMQIGIGTLPFGIVQRGNGMEIRVEHNPIR